MAPNATILGGIAGLTLEPAERDFIRSADPFGFILFARNIGTPGQVRRLTADLRDAVGRDAIITVDQEGGRVQRLRGPHWTEWAAPLDQGLGRDACNVAALSPDRAGTARDRHRQRLRAHAGRGAG